jgi:hypothetical protein
MPNCGSLATILTIEHIFEGQFFWLVNDCDTHPPFTRSRKTPATPPTPFFILLYHFLSSALNSFPPKPSSPSPLTPTPYFSRVCLQLKIPPFSDIRITPYPCTEENLFVAQESPARVIFESPVSQGNTLPLFGNKSFNLGRLRRSTRLPLSAFDYLD